MNLNQILQLLLGVLNSIPAVGPYLVIVMNWIMPLAAIATSLVAVWHAVVLALQALAKLPALGGLQALADKLVTDDAAVESFLTTYLLPFLAQFSVLPLPAKAKK